MKHLRHVTCAALLITTATAAAWNDCTHMVIAEIAYQQLKDDPGWPKIVELLKAHPYPNMLKEKMPKGLSEAEQLHFMFLAAATWPDKVRASAVSRWETKLSAEAYKALRSEDHPHWHFVNYPIERGVKGKQPFTDRWKKGLADEKLTILQALEYAEAVLHGTAKTEGDPAVLPRPIALCWMLHLIGDLHQPLHTTALFSEEFKNGDRGGNEVKFKSYAPLAIPAFPGRSPNLHALWDWIACTDEDPRMADVQGLAAELLKIKLPDTVNVSAGNDDWVRAWAQETHVIARKLPGNKNATGEECNIYTNLLDREGALSASYLGSAMEAARTQVIKAGLRLAARLKKCML